MLCRHSHMCVCVSVPDKYTHVRVNCTVKCLLARGWDKVSEPGRMFGVISGHALSSVILPLLQRVKLNVFPNGISSKGVLRPPPHLSSLMDGKARIWFSCRCCFAVCSVFSLWGKAGCRSAPPRPTVGSSLILRAQESSSPSSILTSLCMDGAFIPLPELCKGHQPTRGCSQPSVSTQHCSIPHSSASASPKSSLQPPDPGFWQLEVSFLCSWTHTLSLSRSG